MRVASTQVRILWFSTFLGAVLWLFTSVNAVTGVKQAANNVNTGSNTASQKASDSGNKTENTAEKQEAESKISKILVALSNGTEESASLRVAIRSSQDNYENLISSKGEAFESMDANGDTACFFSRVYGTKGRMVLRCYVSGKQVLEHDTSSTDHAYHPHVHIDPFAQNVYWRHGETGNVWITSLKTNVSVLVHSATQLWKANSLFAVDPFEGLIFSSSNASEAYCGIGIQKLGSSESDSYALLRGKDLQNETLCANIELALDVQEKTVYWLTPNNLSVGKYDGSVVSQFPISASDKRIYQGRGLKYFEDELFWMEPSFSIFIHSFHLPSNKTKPEIQNMNCSITEDYLNATFLVYGKPPRNLINPCENLTCSHVCIMRSKNAADCYCPFGMKLIGSNHCSPISFGLISTDGDHGVIVVTETTPNAVAGQYSLSPKFDLKSSASAMNGNLTRICYVRKEDCSCFHCQEVNSKEGSDNPKIFNITKDQRVKALVFDKGYSSVFSISTGNEVGSKWCIGQTRLNVNENETWSELVCVNDSLQVSAIDPLEDLLYYFDQVSSTIKVIKLFNVTDTQEPIKNVTNVSQIFIETNSDDQKFIVGLDKNNTKFWVNHLDEGTNRDFHYIKPTHPVQFAYQNNRLYWSEKALENSTAALLLKSYSLLTKTTEEIKFPKATTFRGFFLGRGARSGDDNLYNYDVVTPSNPTTELSSLYFKFIIGLMIFVVILVSSGLMYGEYSYRRRQNRQTAT